MHHRCNCNQSVSCAGLTVLYTLALKRQNADKRKTLVVLKDMILDSLGRADMLERSSLASLHLTPRAWKSTKRRSRRRTQLPKQRSRFSSTGPRASGGAKAAEQAFPSEVSRKRKLQWTVRMEENNLAESLALQLAKEQAKNQELAATLEGEHNRAVKDVNISRFCLKKASA